MSVRSADTDVADLLRICEEVTRGAGRYLLARSTEPLELFEVGERDYSTAIDVDVQRLIVDEIRSHYPTHDFLTEEPDEIPRGREFTWIVDPLDGSANYGRGKPLYAVSVAVAMGGELVAGAVHDPARDELFSAMAGSGLRVNGDATAPTRPAALPQAVVAFDWDPTDTVRARGLCFVASLSEVALFVDAYGSAALALAWVAAGRIDGYVNLRLKPWDAAAGCLLVREADGVVTDGFGAQWSWPQHESSCVAAGRELWPDLLRLVRATGGR